jgi:hypothetical protein
MDQWAIIKIEGYCSRYWDYMAKSDPIVFTLDGEERPNPEYDPNVVVPEEPRFCKGNVGYICLEYSCPYFAFCEFEEIDEEDGETNC